MAAETAENRGGGANIGRYALILAGVIALASAGVALWRNSGGDTPAAATEAAKPGDVGEEIASLESKLKDNPNDANGWRMLGWSFFQTGKYAEAASAYGRAAQLAPQNPEYWSSLGEARVLAGKGDVPPEAKEAFDKAISLDPKDPRARYFLAVAKDISGDHKGAIDDWFALLADTPDGAPWEADLKRIIADVGKKENIPVEGRMAALKKTPPERAPGANVAAAAIPGPTAAQMREAASMPKGQQDAMIQGMVDGLEGKLKANPDNPNGWIMLMRSRMQLGETAKASAALKSARSAFAGNQQKLGMVNAAANELNVPGR
jgi:cytochrome c-type biogenesis protein CcmH